MNEVEIPPTKKFEPTPEQSYLVNTVRDTSDNILVESLAGTGKTSSLVLTIEHLSLDRILCLAFNTRIKDSMDEKYQERAREVDLPPADIRTINSLGFRVIRDTVGAKVTVDLEKMKRIVALEIKSLKSKTAQNEAWDHTHEIYSALRIARAMGYVPEGAVSGTTGLTDLDTFYNSLEEEPTELIQVLVDAILASDIEAVYRGNIDLGDQIYFASIFGGAYTRYDAVLVDETQDLNPCMHQMLWRMRKSRIIGFGDDNQSIYEFNGAVPGGMDKMAQRFNMTRVPLSVSFRCPETIVRNVHWHVPHMRWFKTGGYVGTLRDPCSTSFLDDSAIICRNNAPLYSLAFRLLAAGRNVTVAGSDIGSRIVNIMRKLGDASMSRDALLIVIEQWRQEKLARESKTADDTANCMEIFARKGRTLDEAILYAQSLFNQRGPLTLITGHKAKGLEWDTVYHLDPWLIKDNTSRQEANLRYVIQTRALSEYYEFNSAEVNFE